MSILPHFYNNQQITQTSEDAVIAGNLIPKGYCSATDMCKANSKRWSNYAQNKSSKAYWNALSLDTGIPLSKLVIEIKGTPDGDASLQGTWVHPLIAKELSRWCKNNKPIQTEKTIQQKMHKQLGGEKEVLTDAGLIDLLTKTELIEIKQVKNWKTGVGQLVLFSVDYPTHKKRLHLFGSVSISMLRTIERYCHKLQIFVTTEETSINLKPIDAVPIARLLKSKQPPQRR